MNLSKIKALSFDAAGTLIHLAEPVGESYSRVASEFGIRADPQAIHTAFSTVWTSKAAPFSSAEITELYPDEKDWWRSLVREVFELACGENLVEQEAVFGAFFDQLYLHFESPGTWIADPNAKAVLQTLSVRFPCALLSNFDSRLRKILTELDLLEFLNPIILSSEVKASKPDPGIFRITAEALGFAPEEILHIGDDPECDWEGAENAGFHQFRCGPKGQSLGEILTFFS